MGNQTHNIDGITFDWLDDGAIFHVKFKTVKRQSLIALEAVMEDVVQAWDLPTFRILIDLSEGNFSPHLRQISNVVAKIVAEKSLTGQRAIVIPSGVLGSLVTNWVQFIRRHDAALETRIFQKQELAHQWLISA